MWGDKLEFDKFGWSELISLASVCIAFATICISTFGKSKNEAQNSQRLIDRLDRLNETTHETRNDIRSLTEKVDDYGNRLTKAETDIQSIYRRIGRVESRCDKYLHPILPGGEGTD